MLILLFLLYIQGIEDNGEALAQSVSLFDKHFWKTIFIMNYS